MLLLAGRLTIFCRNIVSSSPISLHYRYAYSSSNSLENDLGESASASSQLSGLKATNSYEGPLHTPILIPSISSTASVFLSSQPRAPRQAWIETLKLYNGDKENSKAKPLDHNLPLGLVDLSPEVFATFPRLDLVHKNLYWQAHYRIVDWRCITRRSEMTYRSQRKPWPQKGTGRARHGNRRTHLWHGGSQCKGPRGPTAFFSVLPRHVRLAGLISMLTVKHAQEEAYTLFAHANASRKAAFAKSGLNHLDNKDMLETLKIAEQQARFIEVSNASALYLRELISARNWGSSVLFITE
ncbi:unnamed protein product [Protopolystoma xenopodis]|uniref:Large ribosomal subunit protein uL4m n=1 Tax=Protopolystoma xenopodis TaxID=117903 RepID=A0A3S5FFS5_9PLAT|nr:unnamed protein product [Protopolystoma xenopodis]